jgi:nucleoside-triphosphatase THEP1
MSLLCVFILMELESLLAEEKGFPQLLFVTGASEAGKTTWCLDMVQQARRQGLRVAGLLSPAVYCKDIKVGIDLMDLSSEAQRRLADLRPEEKPDAPTKKWIFRGEVLRWGNQRLCEIGACDLLVIDELGPLEFLHDQGFTSAFPLIDRRKYRLALVVVRPSLLSQAMERWRDLNPSVHEVLKQGV